MNSQPAAKQQAQGIAIDARDIVRQFPGGVRAIDQLSLAIPAGQFVSLLGPSGCGKSTLLRLFAGLDQPQAGVVHLEGAPVQRVGGGLPRGSIAFVFQDAHLLPWRNVLRNVMLPTELWGTPKAQRRDEALQVIEQVGLADAVKRYPAQLSGGMRMRVSLARALVTRPRLLLLDEPFAALDELTRHRLDEQLRSLWLERGMTVVFVTHSISEAAFLAQRAVVFSPRPARVVADHTLDLPTQRSSELRGTPEFAAQCGLLLRALTQGGA